MTTLPQPRKTPRQARSQSMVETILDATARVLAERGYAGTNTNAVAARAGVSVGSVYQYFPNKDALVTALHAQHGEQMHAAMLGVLEATHPRSLRGHIQAMLRALMAAHQVSPALHKVLEKELPFFDAPKQDGGAEGSIFLRVRQLLDDHREEISPRNRDLATWTVLRVMESMVHAAVIDPPARFTQAALEGAIVDVVMGYLTAGQGAGG